MMCAAKAVIHNRVINMNKKKERKGKERIIEACVSGREGKGRTRRDEGREIMCLPFRKEERIKLGAVCAYVRLCVCVLTSSEIVKRVCKATATIPSLG